MAPHRRWLVIGAWLAGVVVSLVFPPPLAAQQEDKPLRLDVKLVNLFVNVTDRNGALVGGLTKEDFAVTEDNRPQQIAVFEKQSEMPLNLTLAIDTSSSTYKDRAIEQAAAKKFVRALIRPQDLMSVIQFNTYVEELTGFTNSVAQIDHGLDHMHGAGGTALYDAIYAGSQALGRKFSKGVRLYIGLEAIGEADDKGMRTVMTTLNGQLRPVFVRDRSITVETKAAEKADSAKPGHVAAPFSGVVTLHVVPGDTVAAGQAVASIEAMKMEAGITAPVAGTIERLAIPKTQQVDAGDLLVVITPA